VANLGKSDGGKSWIGNGHWNIQSPAIIHGPALTKLLNDENGALVSVYLFEKGIPCADFYSKVHAHREIYEGPQRCNRHDVGRRNEEQ
jgi:hypothetical protein